MASAPREARWVGLSGRLSSELAARRQDLSLAGLPFQVVGTAPPPAQILILVDGRELALSVEEARECGVRVRSIWASKRREEEAI
ncbi:MAG: hypothetical protein SGPRY_014567, partial [Prymnesium sp.]